MAAYVTSYIHSDKSTHNKGGSLVVVNADTDFATRTASFVEFANKIAKYAYAFSSKNYEDLVTKASEASLDLEVDRIELQKTLKEKIWVSNIKVSNPDQPVEEDKMAEETKPEATPELPTIDYSEVMSLQDARIAALEVQVAALIKAKQPAPWRRTAVF